jgi:hypothetical protein
MKLYPTSGIYPRLFPEELAAALNLWRAGKSTYQISKDLRGTKHAEPSVANSLAHWWNEEYLKRRAVA